MNAVASIQGDEVNKANGEIGSGLSI